MRSLRTSDGGAGQLDLFVGAGSDIAARDAQDLMAWPFFSLAKSKRVKPIDFRMGEVAILSKRPPNMAWPPSGTPMC
jgi:plasmid replication initiation protein